MDFQDAARIIVVLTGGCVIGAGFAILLARRRFYQDADLPMAARAMLSLCAVNTLVLAYVTAVLVERWGENLSWRWVLALAIFALKGWFFHDLRATEIEQERRRLYGE
jgi:hypothetical protein